MAYGRCFHKGLPDPTFPLERGPNMAFADDATLLDATNQAFRSMADVESYLPFDDIAHLLPVAAANLSTFYEGDMTMLDARAFQVTSQMDLTSTAITLPHLHPPEMMYSGLNDTPLQKAPVLRDSSNTSNRTASRGDMNSFARPQQTQYATADDWNHHRDLFTKLYLIKNKTLNEVKSIMKEQYGFNATDKMYKKHINKWELYKNCKYTEKEEILHHVDSNSQLGVDLGHPMLNGRPIKMHVLERHRKEKRKARPPSPNLVDRSAKALSDSHSAKRARPQGPTCCASISFSRIDDPRDYRDSENLIFQIDQYYRSKLEKDPQAAWNAWTNSSRGRKLEVSYTFQGINQTCVFDGYAGTVFDRFSYAISYLKDGCSREAWRMIEEGAEMIRPLLMQEPSWFFGALLELNSWRNSSEYIEVLQHLLCFLSGMAIVVHGERHPISNVCRLLRNLYRKGHVIELTLRKLRDILKHCLGEGHSAVLHVQNRICRELTAQKRYDEAERSLRDLVKVHERSHGRDAYETRYARSQLADVYYLTYRDSEAEDNLEKVLRRCKERGQADYLYARTKNFQAWICQDRGDYSAAEVHLWSALSSTLLRYGPRGGMTTQIWMH